MTGVVEPSAKAVEWANKHRDVFSALLRAGYSREEALDILRYENWQRIYEEEET